MLFFCFVFAYKVGRTWVCDPKMLNCRKCGVRDIREHRRLRDRTKMGKKEGKEKIAARLRKGG